MNAIALGVGYSVMVVSGLIAVAAAGWFALELVAKFVMTASVVVDAVRWRAAVKEGKLAEPRVLSRKSDAR